MSTSREHPRRCGGDRGSAMPEYSLLLGLVVIACVMAIAAFGLHTTGVFDRAGDGFSRTPTSSSDPDWGAPGDEPGPLVSPATTSTTTPDCPTTEPSEPGGGDPDCTTTVDAP